VSYTLVSSVSPAYTGLEIFWFVVIAILWVGYFVLEGFDFGIGMLLPVLGRDDIDRRVLINTIGPVWDGNEVWLLVAGGATFAAFPNWYAVLFSGFYLPLFLILAALIFRGVAFEWRAKRDLTKWRSAWDLAIFLGSLIPALLWGVAFANILRGVPIGPNFTYLGSFFNLLNPYSLVGGVTTLLLFALHGAIFASLKTTDELHDRAARVAKLLAPAATAVLVAFLVWTYVNAHNVHNTGLVPPFVPILCIAAVAAVGWLLQERLEAWAFVATAVGLVCLVATIFLNLYPRVMVSSISPGDSLTIGNAASARYTLEVMTIVALIFTPIVLLYQGWSYWVFRGRLQRPPVTAATLAGGTGLDAGPDAEAVTVAVASTPSVVPTTSEGGDAAATPEHEDGLS
jgi:cytochrome d ubiquinol oxidase subunit II